MGLAQQPPQLETLIEHVRLFHPTHKFVKLNSGFGLKHTISTLLFPPNHTLNFMAGLNFNFQTFLQQRSTTKLEDILLFSCKQAQAFPF